MTTFLEDAENVRIDDDHILRARLRDNHGEWQEAEIDLDSYIGNTDGSLFWDGKDFSKSASGATYTVEGERTIPMLKAVVPDSDGNEFESEIMLGDRIMNSSGSFVFSHVPPELSI